MKIEKISDNQIRCTLNKTDLASREIKISELAYGTEKAKSLFRDMMQQASYEFGFENVTKIIENTPEAEKEKEDSDTSESANLIRIYSFHDFKTIESLASILREVYFGKNSLYRNPVSRTYYLILNKSEHTPVQFNQIINIVSEYGNKEAVSIDRELFYQEHYQTILKDSALQILANIL